MNIDEIKALVEILEDSSLSTIEIEEKDKKIKLEKHGGVVAAPQVIAAPAPVVAAPAAAAPVAPSSAALEGDVITSPMVGTYYESPSPDTPAFVKAGSTVSKGDKLCILEAMKIFNEIEAEFDCTILEVLIKDGQVVEYDTPLFRVEKK